MAENMQASCASKPILGLIQRFLNKKIVQEADGKLVIKVPKTRQSNRSVDIPTVLLNELYRRKQELDEAKQANPLLWEQNRGKVIDDRNMEQKLIDSPDFICVGKTGSILRHRHSTTGARLSRKKSAHPLPVWRTSHFTHSEKRISR